MNSRQYICTCFYRRNIFIKRLNLHLTYENDEQFNSTYVKLLREKGCNSEDIRDIKNEVLKEVERRQRNSGNAFLRWKEISCKYTPLYPDIYQLKESMLAKEFIDICKAADNALNKYDVLKMLTTHTANQVYSFPVFEEDFCDKFIEELKHFESSDLPKGRPNSMNTTGILLEELGFYPHFIDMLRESYLSPIVSNLYPNILDNSCVDSQRAFVVSYNHVMQGDQSDLDTHYDNAEVTINISLNDNYTGGELYFTHAKNEAPSDGFHKVDHKKGWGVLHRGAHFHGAMPLESGERYNLIIWMRSSHVRNKVCPMCDDVPVLEEVQCDGDGFTKQTLEMCKLT